MKPPVEKPFSQACENNKVPIFIQLRKAFANTSNVLEVGTGTGQHAVYFAAGLKHVNWHCSDLEEHHAGINQWIDEYPSPNLVKPKVLKLARDQWLTHCDKGEQYDGIYSANTAHIMQGHEIKAFMQSVDEHLPREGVFCQYGPFIVDGKFTSQSNEDFHHRLIESGRGGYRDLDELSAWAPELLLSEVKQMPANNLMLVWKRK